jgi:hypothetical protein
VKKSLHFGWALFLRTTKITNTEQLLFKAVANASWFDIKKYSIIKKRYCFER